MRVIFRADSATSIGGGHVMRCLSLAQELKDRDIQVGFVSRNLPGNLISLLQEKDIPVSILPAPTMALPQTFDDYGAWLGVMQVQDSIQTIEALGGEKADWLIVDHYGLDIEWERDLRFYCDKLMVIDDLANRKHHCDVLLDQNYSMGSGKRYETLVPPSCNILLGPSYALLRKEFEWLRQNQEPKTGELNFFLVFFTLGDDQGETLKAMKGILLFNKARQVDVVIGDANPDKNSIKEMCAIQQWNYHCQVEYMPTLIARADLIIGGGGSSNWERCALGVPALVVTMAENQAAITHALDDAGAVINLGSNVNVQPNDYANTLKAITPRRLKSLSENASRLVDARGVQRIVKILMAERLL